MNAQSETPDELRQKDRAGKDEHDLNMFLPTHRAFLVRLSSDADPSVECVTGRVEHVLSGKRAHFSSTEELYSFVIRVLEEEATKPRENPPEEDGHS